MPAPPTALHLPASTRAGTGAQIRPQMACANELRVPVYSPNFACSHPYRVFTSWYVTSSNADNHVLPHTVTRVIYAHSPAMSLPPPPQPPPYRVPLSPVSGSAAKDVCGSAVLLLFTFAAFLLPCPGKGGARGGSPSPPHPCPPWRRRAASRLTPPHVSTRSLPARQAPLPLACPPACARALLRRCLRGGSSFPVAPPVAQRKWAQRATGTPRCGLEGATA